MTPESRNSKIQTFKEPPKALRRIIGSKNLNLCHPTQRFKDSSSHAHGSRHSPGQAQATSCSTRPAPCECGTCMHGAFAATHLKLHCGKHQQASASSTPCNMSVTHHLKACTRRVLECLQQSSQAQRPYRGLSVHTRHTRVGPPHPEALCCPSTGVAVPGGSKHSHGCLACQESWGIVGKSAAIGQSGRVVPQGVACCLVGQHLLTAGTRSTRHCQRLYPLLAPA